jgi:hypothetical protein
VSDRALRALPLPKTKPHSSAPPPAPSSPRTHKGQPGSFKKSSRWDGSNEAVLAPLSATLLAMACAGAPNPVRHTHAGSRSGSRALPPTRALHSRSGAEQQFLRRGHLSNAAKIGEVTGNHDAPLFIRDSQLRNGRCATVVIRLIIPGTVKSTTQECVPLGGHYQLDIDPSSNLMPLHVWLTPRDGSGP